MANNIFDWDDDDEKSEPERRPQSIDRTPENVPETAYWNDYWQNDDDAREVEQPAQHFDPWKSEADNSEFERPVEFAPEPTTHITETADWNAPWDDLPDDRQYAEERVEYVQYQPESAGETARRGGLAWSAGIVFFSAIVFMLFLGWGADTILGSSPWGIVGGIVLGSIIGFIQFFRISSQIFNTSKSESQMRPLMPHDDDER